MDNIARYNVERWKALADADAPFTRPALDLTPETARESVDPDGLFGEVRGKSVLCLASGGGQQSAAFALLGANVTVFDLSPEQLERDRLAASHYGVPMTVVQGDMRDLSAFEAASFDLVFQPYSLGFVPDATEVFAQVARALRPGGTYYFAIGNPFICGTTQADWDGEGYALKRPYVQGVEITIRDPEWVYARRSNREDPPPPECREYRQTLSVLVNSLIGMGFTLIHLSDSKDFHPDPNDEPGSWGHFVSIAPPWLAFWFRYQPGGND